MTGCGESMMSPDGGQRPGSFETDRTYVAPSQLRRRLGREIERNVADLAADDLVLVACSGGADSLALAAVAADTAARGVIRVGAIVINHQLQPHADEVAAVAAGECVRLGLSPVEVVDVHVPVGPGSGGLESAARASRRRALLEAARRHSAAALLLGHTRDDQAETVLLGLARGSGTRSLQAMAAIDGLWRRPLLAVNRSETRELASELGLRIHDDPHNIDDRFTRVRIRRNVLPVLEANMGPGVVDSLARTAELLRVDNAALDQWAAAEAEQRLSAPRDGTAQLLIGRGSAGLAHVPQAIRTRLYRLALLASGCPPGSLSAAHLAAIDRFISDWRGQGPTRVPGDIEVKREHDKLDFYPGARLGAS